MGKIVFLAVVGAIVMAILLGFLLAFPVMWLWNYVMPVVFALPTLTFWKAWALLILSNFLFKSSTTVNKS